MSGPYYLTLLLFGMLVPLSSATTRAGSSADDVGASSASDIPTFNTTGSIVAAEALSAGHDRTNLQYSIPDGMKIPLVTRQGLAGIGPGIVGEAAVFLAWEDKRQHLVIDMPALKDSVYTRKHHLSIRCNTFTKPVWDIQPRRFHFNKYCHRTYANLMYSCKVPLDHISRHKHAHCPGGQVLLGCGQDSDTVVSQTLKVALHFEAERSMHGKNNKQWYEGWALGRCPSSGRKTTASEPACDGAGNMVQQFDIPINCTVVR